MTSTGYTVINIIIVLYLVIKFMTGWRKGLLLSILSLVGTVLCLFGAYYLCGTMADQISLFPSDKVPFAGTVIADEIYPYLNEAVWFVLIFLILRVVLLLVETLIRAIRKIPGIHFVSGVLGGAFGLLTGGLVLTLVCFVLHLPLISNGTDIIDNTVLSTVDSATSGFREDFIAQYVSLPDILSSDTGTDTSTDTSTGDTAAVLEEAYNSLSDEQQEEVQNILESTGIDSAEEAESIYSSLSDEEKEKALSWLASQGIDLTGTE